MNPWVLIDTVKIAGGDDLRLMKRGMDFSIMSGRAELMNSRVSGSEKALATLACARLAGRRAPNVLIGGLGMGFTLRAALGHLGRDARITVAELVPAVLAWAQGPLAELFADSLVDPRLTIWIGDVGIHIDGSAATFDAILLDVDNGPDGLTRQQNEGLYGLAGLAAARRALKPGGILAVWSAAPDKAFARRLADSGFEAEEVRLRANGAGGGARHVIWIATTPKKASRRNPLAGTRR